MGDLLWESIAWLSRWLFIFSIKNLHFAASLDFSCFSSQPQEILLPLFARIKGRCNQKCSQHVGIYRCV